MKRGDKSRAVGTISHSIISACQPRSFGSPVQLGILLHLHSKISGDAFVQFAFDNVDVNTRTINEHGAVHILDGIKCTAS
ncbi:hypothetical protein PR048_029946 [Dryococelus australis]|uniref:Uncharacterized protein n=1 Tax=Dryococelus australis TaxID=614101 RepID=A0ABQ9G7K3_9NEOP|nr:hypothetical protein PR048_029946 [Dryococelus australis]